MSVQLLSPWMLWGLAALAVPLLIHLLTRHTPRVVPFPTLQFLRRALARQSRIMRLRHLLLLLLRLLVILLLVAAFVRPLLRLPFQKGRDQRARTATVIAIDTSLSMGYQSAGATPLDRAKAEAVKILQALRGQDDANLLFVSGAVASAEPELTESLGTLRDDVEGAKQTLEEADFNAAISRALEEFGRPEAEDREKELYLVSDFQRTNWASVRLESVPSDVQLYLIDVDSGLKRNAAITEVHTRPAATRAGETIELACEVGNFAPESRSLPVTLTLHRAESSAELARQEQRVLVPGYGSATAVFRIRLNEVGEYEGEVRLPADALPTDDVRYVNLDVRKALSLALLTDENAQDPSTSAFYLLRALSPSTDSGGLQVTVLNGKQAAERDLSEADVVFVANLGDMNGALARKLRQYLTNGGTVFYFMGGSPPGPQLAALDHTAPSERVSPYTVGDLLDLKGLGRGYTTWSYARFESPMLKLFMDPEFGRLSDLKFYKYRMVTATDSRAEVLLRYEDSTVAAARSRVGLGSFVLCNFSPHPLYADMMKHQLFPPLLHELIRGAMAEEGGHQEFFVGQTASLGLEHVAPAVERALTFHGPEGNQIGARWQRIGGSVSVLFDNPGQPGFYRVNANGNAIAAAAVNVSPRESDLRELEGSELARKQDMQRRSYAVRADLDPTHVERLRHGRELYYLFALGALLIALVEQVLAYLLRTRPEPATSMPAAESSEG